MMAMRELIERTGNCAFDENCQDVYGFIWEAAAAAFTESKKRHGSREAAWAALSQWLTSYGHPECDPWMPGSVGAYWLKAIADASRGRFMPPE